MLLVCGVSTSWILVQTVFRVPLSWMPDIRDLSVLPVRFRDLYLLRLVASCSVWLLVLLGPGLVFLLIDTLRADRLGSWDYERDTSPTLDRLAATGIRFGRHLAQSSWTKCSMASLWTGLYPARSGVLRYDHGAPESPTTTNTSAVASAVLTNSPRSRSRIIAKTMGSSNAVGLT